MISDWRAASTLFSLFLALILALYHSAAHADLFWQPTRLASSSADSAQSTHHSAGKKRKRQKTFALKNKDPQGQLIVELVHSDLARKGIELYGEVAHIRPTGKNNYHVLVAKEETPGVEKLAVRYLYFNGRPVDTSPSDLLAIPLATLQIIPEPLPREHWKYESLKSYTFRVVFNGQPLPDQPVLASTDAGSSQILHTDSEGFLELMVPDDFKTIVPKKRATPPGEFRLFTTYQHESKTFEASISSDYQANAAYWKNKSLGATVIAMGLFAGFALSRRLPAHNRRKKK